MDGAPSALLSLMPTPEACCSPASGTGCCRDSPSGTMFGHLTASRGPAWSMSSAEDSPARIFQRPGPDLDYPGPGLDCGLKWRGSLAKYDPDSRSWKTAQCSLLGGLESYSETWPRWGLMCDGECWELPALVPCTLESVSGLLPTLTRRDYRSDSCTQKVKAERDAQTRGKSLPWVLGGLVNPPWAEWFMGFPIGWTESRPLEMPRFQEWRQQHGDCSEAPE